MQDNMNSMAPVSTGSVETRSNFIWKVYAHVVGALLAMVAIEYYLFTSGAANQIFAVLGGNPGIALILFIGLSWGASHVAYRIESRPAQYAAFGLYVFLWSVMLVPLLGMAIIIGEERGVNIIENAATVTIMGCVGLIATAMITRKDFSFLRGILVYGFMVILALIASSFIFGLDLGVWFSIGMIAFAGVAVLYDTSNIMHHYPEDKFVGASMALFGSIAMMFFYILRLFMSRD